MEPKSFNSQLRSSSSWSILDLVAPEWANKKSLIEAQQVGLRKLNAAREALPAASDFGDA